VKGLSKNFEREEIRGFLKMVRRFAKYNEKMNDLEGTKSGLLHKTTILNDIFLRENMTLINLSYYTDNCDNF